MLKGNSRIIKDYKKWESQMAWNLTRWEVMNMFSSQDRPYAKEILNNDPRLGVTYGNYNLQGTDTKFYNMHDVFEIAYLIEWGDGG